MSKIGLLRLSSTRASKGVVTFEKKPMKAWNLDVYEWQFSPSLPVENRPFWRNHLECCVTRAMPIRNVSENEWCFTLSSSSRVLKKKQKRNFGEIFTSFTSQKKTLCKRVSLVKSKYHVRRDSFTDKLHLGSLSRSGLKFLSLQSQVKKWSAIQKTKTGRVHQ